MRNTPPQVDLVPPRYIFLQMWLPKCVKNRTFCRRIYMSSFCLHTDMCACWTYLKLRGSFATYILS
jgi:hypothetical protein